MKPTTPKSEKKFNQDLKTFEQLPAKTKELSLLEDRAEKATGPERVALQQAIRTKAR